MRLLCVGDLHGAIPEISTTDVDAILCVGDVCSDEGMRPYIMESLKQFLAEGDAPPWFELAPNPKELVDESIKRGRAVLEKLNSVGVPVFIVPGNWDFVGDDDLEYPLQNHWARVIEGFDNVVDVDGLFLELDDVVIVGYGDTNGPELGRLRGYEVTDQEHSDEEADVEDMVSSYVELINESSLPVILLSHNVVYGTELDLIRDDSSPKVGEHFGSVVVRRVIERSNPLLSVGGHIHDAYGSCMVGNTLCINCGFGPDKNTIITIDPLTVSFSSGAKEY